MADSDVHDEDGEQDGDLPAPLDEPLPPLKGSSPSPSGAVVGYVDLGADAVTDVTDVEDDDHDHDHDHDHDDDEEYDDELDLTDAVVVVGFEAFIGGVEGIDEDGETEQMEGLVLFFTDQEGDELTPVILPREAVGPFAAIVARAAEDLGVVIADDDED